MGVMEIILLVAGGIIFIVSFLLPEKKNGESGVSKEKAQEEIAALVKQEMESVKTRIDEVVEEAVGYAMEKAERSMERLSNEKIMAVSEYSDTVLAEIHRNHEEAMFLYDMLNSKHTSIKNTVSEVNKTVREAEETVSELQNVKPEPATPPVTVQPTRHVEEEVEEVPQEPATASRVSFMDETDEEGRNNNERILALYRQGKSKVAIAKELGLGVGEVKLVIDLFKNQ